MQDAQHPLDWSHLFAARAKGMQASEIRELLKLLDQPGIISFAGGIPDPALFPDKALADAYADILGNQASAAQALQYSVSEGYLPLREWIAAYMGRHGVPCSAGNIVITSGSQQGLDFLGKLLISPHDTVLVAAPTYLGALQAFNPYEPHYESLEIPSGNRTPVSYQQAASDAGGRVCMAYAVTDFANPTGETVSLGERERLLGLAEALDVPLLEDAAYEALRFAGERVPSCLALDIARTGDIERSRVIYCGTFSKTMAPALRIGWICAASELVNKIVLTKQAGDLHSSTLNQMALARVLETQFDAQVARAIEHYRVRRTAMLEALEAYMPAGVKWSKPEGGMFVWLTLPDTIDGAKLLARAIKEEQIAFVPGQAFFADKSGANTLRLSYSLPAPEIIEEGMKRLGRLIRSELA